MTSEPNTVGSTSTNQSTYNLSNDTTKTKEKAKKDVALISFMTKAQADNLGIGDLFDKYDIDKSGKIETNEYINFKTGADPHNKVEFNRDKSKNYSFEEYNKLAVKLCEKFKIDKNTIESILKLRENGPKDTNELVKETFGIDLSQYNTEEEKLKAIETALNDKYKIPKESDKIDRINEIQALIDSGEINKENENDSLFIQEVKRLRSGNYNEHEKEKFGWVAGKDLSAEQLNTFAKSALRRREIIEFTKYFAQADSDAQRLLIKKFGNLDKVVQTGLIGVATLSGHTFEQKQANAKLLKEQDLNLTTEAGTEVFDMNVQTVYLQLSSKDAIEMASDKTKFASKEDNLRAFKLADVTEDYKVQRGDITQEEKDKNYVELYAASAHKLELASEAYKYVIDNANDSNRSATMNMLASTAYQIEDENQRNGAISNIKNSGYYNEEVQKNLDNSYAQKIESDMQKSQSSSDKNNYIYSSRTVQNQTNPINNPENRYNNMISEIVKSGDETKIKEILDKTFNEVNQNGQTSKQKRLGLQRGLIVLTKLISDGMIQNSSYENAVLNKLGALPAPTLLNMFLGANEKVQTYFYKNNLINPLTIAMNATTEEINNLPENIKDQVMVIRNENYLQGKK